MWKTDILFWKLFEQLWTRQEYVIYDWKMAMDWLQCSLINVILYSCYHDIFCYQYEGSIISMILPIWIFINSSTKILRYFLNWDKCNCFLLSFGFISASRILNFFSLLHICKETKFCNTKKKKKKNQKTKRDSNIEEIWYILQQGQKTWRRHKYKSQKRKTNTWHKEGHGA